MCVQWKKVGKTTVAASAIPDAAKMLHQAVIEIQIQAATKHNQFIESNNVISQKHSLS